MPRAATTRSPDHCSSPGIWATGRPRKSRVVEHVFRTPGFHRLGLTVTNGALSDLAWRDLYVVDDAKELATEGQASAVELGRS